MSDRIGGLRSVLLAVGGIAAVSGLYWDDAWHTDVGRDTFFSRPHLLLYAGVSLLLATAASWAWRRYRTEGRSVLRDPRVVLPLLGAAVTLGAAPVDELWHQLFGRDAVTWSPPHMVAVAGMAAFAAGLFLAVTRAGEHVARPAAVVVGAFVIAALVTVVMEFETDVPQFPVVLYLPVSVAALTFAFALVHVASDRAWTVTAAAAVYMGMRVGVVGFLAALEHSLPTVMPTVVGAAAFEVAARRRWTRWPLAAVTAAAIAGSHAAAHRLQPGGLTLTAWEVASGALVGVLLAAAALAAVGVGTPQRIARHGRAVGAATTLVALLLLVPMGPAFAHDPGQGDEVAPVTLQATRHGDRIEVEVAALDGRCDGWEPERVLARRAGRTPTGPLEQVEGCRFIGSVAVDDPGRWFVYTEFSVGGRPTEAWMPVEDGSHRKATALYVAPGEGPPLVQFLAGVALYAVVAGIFAAIALAYRRADASAGDGRGGRAAERVAVGAR
jgi:hypothetical protein